MFESPSVNIGLCALMYIRKRGKGYQIMFERESYDAVGKAANDSKSFGDGETDVRGEVEKKPPPPTFLFFTSPPRCSVCK